MLLSCQKLEPLCFRVVRPARLSHSRDRLEGLKRTLRLRDELVRIRAHETRF